MNPKRLWPCIIATFLVLCITDFVIHGVILKATYQSTQELWRPEEVMPRYMAWMFVGQFVMAASMSVIYAQGFADKGSLKCALMFGLFMGLHGNGFVPIYYSVAPWPALLCVEWVAFGLMQSVLLGWVLFKLGASTTTKLNA